MTTKEAVFYYWAGYFAAQFKIHNLKVVRDNRIIGLAEADWTKRSARIAYSAKEINKCPQWEVMDTVIHELAHIRQNLPYNTEEEQIYSEYRAEKFAIDHLRKLFPRYYHLAVRGMQAALKNKTKTASWGRVHHEAYRKVYAKLVP